MTRTAFRVVGLCLLASVAMAGCAPPEDPARIELRARLKQAATLSPEELARTMEEVSRSLEGKKVQVSQDAMTRELDPAQHDVVLGMLKDRAGVYDEGLRTAQGVSVRVLNAPGLSEHLEYSAARRLFVDVETFLPRRFEFFYEVPGMGDYSLDLIVKP